MKSLRQAIGGLGNIMFKEAYILGQHANGTIPDIYLQNKNFWKPHEQLIKERFNEGIGSDNRVAIHIRRGDYVGNKFYVDLTQTDYYQRAIEEFDSETRFLVFCRDRQDIATDLYDRRWVQDYVNSLGIDWDIASYDNTEVEDLNQMAACSGLIMANSSFSWWGAFLGNPKKKVICPSKWFSDGQERIGLLDEWVKI